MGIGSRVPYVPIPDVPPKRCACGREGEWPGRLCPDCRTTTVVPEDRLSELVTVINSEHAAILRTGRQTIEHAIRCGEALLEARAEVKKGLWLDWYKRNVASTCHITTAHRYMRLADHKEEVLASDVRYIEDAMRLLEDKPRRGYGPRKLSEEDKATLVELYHEEGLRAVMDAFNVAKSTVWRYVSPRSPAQFDPTEPKLATEITNSMIVQMSAWLVERFGGFDYPERVTASVHDDAEKALTAALTIQEAE